MPDPLKDIDIKKLAIDALEDLKAQNILCLDVSDKTDITDYMIVASGTSSRHVKSLANNVVAEAKRRGLQPIGVEGMDQGDWVLIDLNAVIVHLMQPQVRDFYDIESLWSLSPNALNESVNQKDD
ncbi:MAG: ribosome silencing factor [Pseudomonadales bacterium]|nr:ribosome silencing factor [Pseudomonadales bacterium]